MRAHTHTHTRGHAHTQAHTHAHTNTMILCTEIATVGYCTLSLWMYLCNCK